MTACKTVLWPVNPPLLTASALRLSVRTQDFQSCKRGSTPLGRANPDQITHNTYDAANRLTNVQSGYGAGPINVVTNTYTDNSKIATVTDGNGNKSQYTYDGDDRLTQLNYPSKTTPGTVSSTDYEQYSYDANGNQLTVRLRSGETVTNTYDALSRLTQKAWSGGSMPGIYYGYDLLNDLLYARYGSATGYGATFTYDALQRKTSETSSASGYSRTMSSQYDLAGNRTRLTYPDGNYIQYTYDPLNRMKQVQQNGSTVMAEYSYDDLSRESGITRNNGANTSTSYSSTSQDWSLAQGGGMSPAVTYALTYTPAAQVSQRSITSSSAGYKYGVTSSGTNYCPNGLNQYATVGGTGSGCSGGTIYTYDDRGNLTSDGSRSFSYDLANQLTGAGSTSIIYDPLGRLQQVEAASGTTQYLYDGSMLVGEYNTSGTMLRRYVPGQGVDETLVWYEGSDLSSPHWLHTDQQGSVIATTDSSATATPYAYSATGEPKGGWSSSAPAFRYTGQVAIASASLYYYKARMYDPALGRFLQTDPVGYQAGMNLYAYVGNDPINAIDPSGRCQWGSITFPDGTTVSFPPAGSDCDDGAFQDAISRLKDQSDNTLKPALPSQPEQVTVTATRGTNGTPCDTSGTAPSPEDYARRGEFANQLLTAPDPEGNSAAAGTIYNIWELAQFRRGGPLDAQVRYGGSPAYANYAFGVYTGAAGFSLPDALGIANLYGQLRSHYPATTVMDRNYPSIPSANVANISNGFNAYKSGALCRKP